jgi:SAM-dependent methyltransferase
MIKKIIRHLYLNYFLDSNIYWEQRYKNRGTSGAGSYGRLAVFKAEVINEFLCENDIKTAIEFGCGDGNQLSLINYKEYIGLDVSKESIKLCYNKFKNDITKSFFLYDPFSFIDNQRIFTADLSLSLDVIYHLLEEEVFEKYMMHLFKSSNKYVIIYSSNYEELQNKHERRRRFSDFIDHSFKNWKLEKVIPNKYQYDALNRNETSSADFYFYIKEV